MVAGRDKRDDRLVVSLLWTDRPAYRTITQTTSYR